MTDGTSAKRRCRRCLVIMEASEPTDLCKICRGRADEEEDGNNHD